MSFKLFVYSDRWAEYREVEVDVTQDVAIDASVRDWTNVFDAENRSFFSYDIKIPDTGVNNRALGHARDLNIRASDLRGHSLPAIIEAGAFIFRGKLTILEYRKIGVDAYYICQFLGGIRNFIDKLPEFINELELGEWEHSLSSIEDLFDYNEYDGENSATSGLMFWGFPKSDDTENGYYLDYFSLEYQKPFIFLAAIVGAMQNYTGITIKSAFFNSSWFRHLVHDYTNKDRGPVLRLRGFHAEVIADWTYPAAAPHNLNPTDIQWSYTDIAQTFDTAIVDKFRVPPYMRPCHVAVKFDVTVGENYGGRVELVADDVVLDSHYLVKGKNSFTLYSKREIDTDGIFVIRVKENPSTWLPGSTFEIFFDVDYFLDGAILQLKNSLPQISCVEYIKGLTEIFNLVWFYDEENDAMIVEPKRSGLLPSGEYIDGFYRSIAHPADWSDIVDEDGDNVTFNPSPELKRTLIFRFKDDSKDQSGVTKDTFSHKEFLSNKYQNGETEVKNSLFSPCFNRRLPDLINVPGETFRVPVKVGYKYGDEDADRSPRYDFDMSILYKYGLVDGKWRWNDGYSSTNESQYPLVAMVDDERGINVGYADTPNTKGLVSLFYRGDIDFYNRGVSKQVDVLIPLSEIINMREFYRTPKLIRSRSTGDAFFLLAEPRIVLNKRTVTQVKLISYE